MGQTSRTVVEGLLNTPDFHGLAQVNQVKAVEDAYTYAASMAKIEAHKEYEGTVDKWVLTARDSGDPASSILSRNRDKQIEETVNGAKRGMQIAASNGDVGDIPMYVETLRRCGKDDAEIKKDVGNACRDAYKAAYKNGDTDVAFAIQDALIGLNVDFDVDLFKSWRTQADKQ